MPPRLIRLTSAPRAEKKGVMKIFACLAAAAAFLSPLCAFADYDDSPFIPLWKGVKMPGKTTDGPEVMNGRFVKGNEYQAFEIKNVGTPAMQFFKADSAKPTAAVVVCPGGAYRGLQYGHEGVNIAKFLNSQGVSAFVLKYRVPNEFNDKDRVYMDAQRAMRLVRKNAREYNVDPSKVGFMGFSAGGHLSAWMSTNYEKELYAPQDAADKMPLRPDFAILVYPAWLDDRGNAENPYALARDIPVTKDTPPAFIAHNMDDKSFINASIAYYLALKKEGVPVDMHLYSKGGHGYGARPRGLPVDSWVPLLAEWLKYNKISSAK